MQLIINDYVISTSIEEILTKVRSELTNGKLKYFKQKGNEIKVTCPHHEDGQEKNPDCYINAMQTGDLEYGYCHCFACGFSGRLSKFIGECFDKDEQFGENWLVKNFGNSVVDEQNDDLYDFDIVSQDDCEDLLKDNKYIDESILDSMQTWHPYLDKRGISRKVCERFKIRYEPETKCIVFPVWDENSNLYMLTRRSVESKKFIIDSDKEKPIYLYNVIKRNNINQAVICESQINCLTLWSWNIPSVALFGTGTQHQYDILNKSGILRYYLAFDGDGAGDKGIMRFLKNIRKDVFVDVIMIPRGKDVNDLTEEEFNKLNIISGDEWRALYE